MKPSRKLNRRSFLGSVAGHAALGGALGLIGGEARAWQGPPYTGVTDNDTGSNSDNTGYGRGGSRAISDNDPTDPAGYGRNVRSHPIRDNDGSDTEGRSATGQSDRDTGPNRDPPGYGRGGTSGYSDNDSGPNADPSGGGRRGRPSGRYDSDSTDAGGNGRGSTTRPSRYTGITDSDSSDRGGYGIGNFRQDSDHQDQGVAVTRPRSQCTDADSAPNRDPVGRGRHC